SPHGPVHIWSGDPRTDPKTQPAPFGCFYPQDYPYDKKDPASYPVDQSSNIGCIDMGVLATAAQDPIFFAHHSNIDRLWDIWTRIPGNTNPADPNWTGMGWSFYDENKNWVTISVNQVLDEEKALGYSYQPPQVKGNVTTPDICKKPAKRAARAAPQSSLTIAEDEKGITVGTKPHTRSLTLPQEHRTQLKLTAAGTPQKEYVLHIDGISLPPNTGTIMRVFVNLPDANVNTELDAEHFAGYISVVPSGLGHQHPVVRNVAFDLLPELAATVAASERLSVTLVPVTGGGAEPLQAAVTYRRIYLTVK
ncbi:MAG: tyrosinase family protein, partial [Acidobacteria bacterium]|nr:tyrosinase family protein [Acidobacteriota bacterium]